MTDPSPTDTGTLYVSNLQGAPGATLRNAREKAGVSIDEMATKTKIPLNVLQAIEQDDTVKLGQPVYVRGYLRRYAKALGVAESEVMAEFDSRPAARPSMPQPPPREPEPEERSGGTGPLFWLAVIVILAAIAGAGLLYLRGGSLGSLMRRPVALRPATESKSRGTPAERAPSTSDSPRPVPQAAPTLAAPATDNPAMPDGPPPVEQPESGAASPSPTPQAP